MIAFGTLIADGEAYRRYAEPGIARAAEPDSVRLNFAAVSPAGRGINLILEAAAALEDLEALVLVPTHTEIDTAELGARVRAALADPEVALLGAAGARGVSGLAWWEGEQVAASVRRRHPSHGGGELTAWPGATPPAADVDSLDAALLVLSPWAVAQLRCDESLIHPYGFELDLCLAARTAGRRVRVIDLPIIQHGSLELVENLELWTEAHIGLARKWDGVLTGTPERDEAAWEWRARRAEAEREAARAGALSVKLRSDAQLEALERELAAMTATRSWQLTRPLREFNLWRRARRGGPDVPAPAS